MILNLNFALSKIFATKSTSLPALATYVVLFILIYYLLGISLYYLRRCTIRNFRRRRRIGNCM